MSRFNQSIVPLKRQIRELEFIIARTKVTSWQAVQEIVRAGLADKAFKIGDQFVANYAGVSYAWDVIGIDLDTPANPLFTHSMTLQTHDCIGNVQFSAPQALYYAEEELPAGEQIFTDSGGDRYKFTTTQPVPIGGQIVQGGWPTEGYAATTVTTYAADRKTVIESSIAVSPAEAGADTLLEVNNRSRCKYGSNNYKESAIRQWLSSNAAAFAWTPQTKYDRASTAAPYTGAGFLNLLDPELADVLGDVKKTTAKNTVTDGGGSEILSDKIFLLSRSEVYAGLENSINEGAPYPYYSILSGSATTGALDGRIKYLSGSARTWWVRSPNSGNAYIPRIVYTSGELYYSNAYCAGGAAPACCIV